MGRKKQTNSVLAGNNNGGLHSARGLATLTQVLTTHDLKDAVLYQAIFTGTQDKALYQKAIKALMRHIRTKCRAEYIGGYEVGDEKGGLHAHCYIIIETSKHFPADLLDVREGQFLHRLANRKDKELCIRIEPPKNRMHGGQMFARMNTPEKLADCVKWASYYLKPRSKATVPGRETYFGSEFTSNITKREAQRQKHRDALLKSSRPAPAAEVAYEASGFSMKSDTLTSEMPNFVSAFSAVSTSYAPNGASTSANSCFSMALATDRAVASPDASSITISRLVERPARAYVMRNFFMGSGTAARAGIIPVISLITPLVKRQQQICNTGELADPKTWVYNCLTDVRQSYTQRPTQ